jgi:hypothetical protein
MTRRDMGWRAAGSLLIIVAAAIGLADQATPVGGPVLLGLLGFLTAILAITLLVRGGQLSDALRAEIDRRHRTIRNAVTVRRRHGGTERHKAHRR